MTPAMDGSIPRRTSGHNDIARNTAFNLLGHGAPLVVGLVSIPIVAHFLGDVRFGLLGLAWAVLGSFTLVDLGVGPATTKLAAEYLGRGNEIATSNLIRVSTAVQSIIGIAAGIFSR